MVDPTVKRVVDWVANVIWYSLLGAIAAVVGIVARVLWVRYCG